MRRNTALEATARVAAWISRTAPATEPDAPNVLTAGLGRPAIESATSSIGMSPDAFSLSKARINPAPQPLRTPDTRQARLHVRPMGVLSYARGTPAVPPIPLLSGTERSWAEMGRSQSLGYIRLKEPQSGLESEKRAKGNRTLTTSLEGWGRANFQCSVGLARKSRLASSPRSPLAHRPAFERRNCTQVRAPRR
jgi:hypothetical protein